MTTPILEHHQATPPAPLKPMDAERALGLLRAVVAEFGPEYVYVNASGQRAGQCHVGGKTAIDCSYVHGMDNDLRPGCLVGQVCHRHGVPLVVLQTYEGSAFGTFGEDAGIANEDAQQILHAAQMAQDGGRPWGVALQRAEECWERIKEVKMALAEAEA